MRRSFGSQAMDHSHQEGGTGSVSIFENLRRLHASATKDPAHSPVDPEEAVNEQRDARARSVRVRSGPEECSKHIETEKKQGDADEAFRPAVTGWREGDPENDCCGAQQGHCCGVPGNVQQAETHGVPGTGLDAADVGDGGDVVVVQAVAEAKSGGGDQSQPQIDGIHHRRMLLVGDTIKAPRCSSVGLVG